jgi:hypothetical protein
LWFKEFSKPRQKVRLTKSFFTLNQYFFFIVAYPEDAVSRRTASKVTSFCPLCPSGHFYFMFYKLIEKSIQPKPETRLSEKPRRSSWIRILEWRKSTTLHALEHLIWKK